ERCVNSEEFFLGPLESDVQPDELAIEAVLPALPPRTGTAFCEVSRRSGDYAICGVAALLRLDNEGGIEQASAAYLSVAGTPLVIDLTDSCGAGSESFAEAGRLAEERVQPYSDVHATAGYRRHLAGVLTRRALAAAWEQ